MLTRLITIIKREKIRIFRAIKNMGFIAGGLAIMRLSTLLVSIIVARNTDQTTFGQFTLFITLFVLGMEVPIVFDSTYIRFSNNPAHSQDSDTYWVLSLASKILALISALLIVSVALPMLSYDSVTERIIFSGIGAGLLFCIYNSLASRCQQRKEFTEYSKIKPLAHLALLAIIYFYSLYIPKISISGVLNSYLLVGVVCSIFTILIISIRVNFKIDALYRAIRPYYGVAIFLLLSSLISKTTAKMDVFILNNYLTYEQLSDYGIALRVSLVVSVITGISSVLLYPRAPEICKDKDKLKNYFGLFLVGAIPQTFIALCLLLFTDNAIQLLFGANYNSSTSVTISRIMIITVLLTSYIVPFQALVQFGSHPRRLVYITAIKSIIAISLMLLAVPVYGVFGAAYVLLFVSCISLCAFAYFALLENAALPFSRNW